MVSSACVAAAAVAAFAQTASAGIMHKRDSVPAAFVAAPYYPSPHGGWTADWSEAYAKAYALVSSMTLAEKTNITAGTGYFMGPCVGNTGSAPRVGFPNLCLQDSALGVRSTDNITAFPAGITVGATFDKDLMLARGEALGEEFRGKGVNIYLGPTIGPLGRQPRGGRNWEGFGADPVLQAYGGALTIKGVQAQGVIATVKHFVGYEQEMYRMYNAIMPAYSSNIDDRTLHELYAWPFADAVRAGAGSVMSAYSAVNGSASSQNSYLINNILKQELGFQGFVMSDWYGQMSGVPAALAGLDMGMPGDGAIPLLGESYFMFELTKAALNGSVPMDRLNDMATRVVAAWYQMGQDKDYPPPNFSSNTKEATGLLYPGALLSPSGIVNHFVNVQADHAVVARQVATDAITLLKNSGSLLPLAASSPLAVFGTGAAVNPNGPNACADRACNTGTLGMGWGSGVADYPYFDDPISALRNRSAADVTFYQTDTFPSSASKPSADQIAVVFISSDSGENQDTVDGNHGDRDASGLTAWHNGDALVKAVANVYSNVVVVVHTVGPILMESWVDLPSVKSVLVAHLPGQEAGESLADVLYGTVSPSGHLPYSIPKKEGDYPSSLNIKGFALGQIQNTFSEGLYIDYRYLQKNGITPRYAFGHGLSYANFSLSSAAISVGTALTGVLPGARPSKLASPAYNTTIPSISEALKPAGFNTIWRYLYSWISEDDAKAAAKAASSGSSYPYPTGYSATQQAGTDAGGAQGGNPALFEVAYAVSVKVANQQDAKHGGKAVVQAYIQHPASSPYDTPIVQLRDFAKTATLAPGGASTVSLQLTRRDLSVWDVEQQNWVLPGLPSTTRYTIWLGDASDQLHTACYTDTLTCESGLAGPL